MEMSNQEDINLFGFDIVEKGSSIHSIITRMLRIQLREAKRKQTMG